MRCSGVKLSESLDGDVRQLEDMLQTLEAQGAPEAELVGLKQQLREIKAQMPPPPLPSPPPPSPPSLKLQKLDETLRGLREDGIPAAQLEPLKLQIEELRAQEGAAPAVVPLPPSLSLPPPTTTNVPSNAMKNTMTSIFGVFGVSSRELSPEEVEVLERREEAARAAQEVERAETDARRKLDESVMLLRQGIEALEDGLRRGRLVQADAQREGREVLRFLGDAKRDEKRERIGATVADVETKRVGACALLEAAETLAIAAKTDVSVAADLERGRELLSEASRLMDELVVWREEMEKAL